MCPGECPRTLAQSREALEPARNAGGAALFRNRNRLRKEFAIATDLLVPKTGGMNTTKVTVVRWIKNEGESFKQGEPLVELETEKVSYELDAPEDGVLLKILVREPNEVDVGGTLGTIGKPGEMA